MTPYETYRDACNAAYLEYWKQVYPSQLPLNTIIDRAVDRYDEIRILQLQVKIVAHNVLAEADKIRAGADAE